MSSEESTATFTVDGKSVTVTVDELTALNEKLQTQQNRPGIPITGKFLNTILKQVCYKKHKDEPEKNIGSIAVGDTTIAASNTRHVQPYSNLQEVQLQGGI